MAVGSGSARADFRRAALTAGLLSGLPSTCWAIVRGADPLESSRAAGRMLLPRARSDVALLAAAGVAHAALTVGWTAVLRRLPGAALPGAALRGAGYGLGIAALDLGVAHAVRGHRFAAVADLPLLPQVADHVAFGVLAISWTGRARPSAPRAGS